MRNLTSEQAARIQRAVDTNGDPSDGEIVREALRLWEQREETRALELARLKRHFDEGKASGEGREIDRVAFLKSLKAERSVRG